MSHPQNPPSEHQDTAEVKRGKSKSRTHRQQRKERITPGPQQEQNHLPSTETVASPAVKSYLHHEQTRPIAMRSTLPQQEKDIRITEPLRPSPSLIQEAIEKLRLEIHPPNGPNNPPRTTESNILIALSEAGYIIPENADLSSPLFLIKKNTPYPKTFNTLIEQMSVQLGRLKEELLKPSAGNYAWKEKVMFEMLVEVVPRIAGLAREIGVEVGEVVRVHGGGMRLFVGAKTEEENNDIAGKGEGENDEMEESDEVMDREEEKVVDGKGVE